MSTYKNDMNDEWLVSYLLGEADAGKREEVEAWMGENDANRRYFEQFRLLWESSRALATQVDVDEQAAWQRFRERTYLAPTKGRGENLGKYAQWIGKLPMLSKAGRLRSMGDYARVFRIAASILLIAGLGVFAYFLLDRTGNQTIHYASLDSTAVRKLSDGSVVTLNHHTTISYEKTFSGNQRKVELQGEAFFQVEPDPSKPFVVEVNDLTVTVLGTSFNIASTPDQVEVIVESGSVKVQKEGVEVVLHPNESITVRREDTTLQKEEHTDQLYNYYRTGEFVCDNTPLWKLVEVLNSAFQAKIVIQNEALRNLPLTTTFYNESLENILGVISETFSISVEHQQNRILLK